MKDERKKKKNKKGGGRRVKVSRFARSSSPLWVVENNIEPVILRRQEWKEVLISLSKGITNC